MDLDGLGPKGLLSVAQALGEELRQSDLKHLSLHRSDIVVDSVETKRVLLVVIEGAGGPRIPVSRLAHGAGVQDPGDFGIHRYLLVVFKEIRSYSQWSIGI